MEFKQFLDNWEYIAGIIASVLSFFGIKKGVKVVKNQIDKAQSKGIKENASDITTLKNDMIEVKAKQKAIVLELSRNSEADLERYSALLEMGKDTNKTVKDSAKQFNDFIQNDWVDLIKKVYSK